MRVRSSQLLSIVAAWGLAQVSGACRPSVASDAQAATLAAGGSGGISPPAGQSAKGPSAGVAADRASVASVPAGSAEQAFEEGLRRADEAAGRSRLRQAAEGFAQAGNTARQAEALYWLAASEQQAGNAASALAAIEQAREIHREEVEFFSPNSAAQLAGELRLELGQPAAARAELERLLARAKRAADTAYQWRATLGLARVDGAEGRLVAARERFAAARAMAAATGTLRGEASVLADWAAFEAAQGDVSAARRYYRLAVDEHRAALALLQKRDVPQRAMHRELSRQEAAKALLALAVLEQAEGHLVAAHDASQEGTRFSLALTSSDQQGDSPARARQKRLDEELSRVEKEISIALIRQWGFESVATFEALRSQVRPGTEGVVYVGAELARRLTEDPAVLLRSARWVPEQREGVRIGVRLFGVRDYSLPGALGLQNGDRLVSLNGLSFSESKALERHRAELQRASEYVVELDRKGARQSLRIVVQAESRR